MLSVDNFEEQLQEEYGKIFNNISYFRARKRKYRFHELGNGECLVTSYKIDEGRADLLSDELLAESTDNTSAEQDMINTDKYRSLKTRHLQKEGQNGENPLENESKNCSLYEKVAMDLETVFNKYMTINPDPGSEKSLDGEENAEGTLDETDISEREKAILRNEITFKTVRTKNDTLYIWTAHV